MLYIYSMAPARIPHMSFKMVKMVGLNKGWLGMMVVQLAYAGMAMFSKASIDKGMNPYVFVVYRQAFATITLAPFAYFLDRKKAHPLSYGLIFKIFFVSFFGITLSLNLYFYAINYVSATFASASINTIPAITFLIAVIFRIETFSMRNLPGIAKFSGSILSLTGAMVFAFVKGPGLKFMNWGGSTKEAHSTTELSFMEKWVQGCLLMLAATVIWACWLVMQAPLVKEYPAKFRLTMLQCFFSCTQSSIWAIIMERDISSWKLKWDFNLFSVAYCGMARQVDVIKIFMVSWIQSCMGIVVTGISYWLQLWVVEKKGPLFAASFTPLILIFTAILSAVIWKEMLYLGSFVGGILVIGGLYCIIWGKNQEAKIKEESQEKVAEEEIVVV